MDGVECTIHARRARDRPEMAEIMTGISEAALREELILCTKTPFSP